MNINRLISRREKDGISHRREKSTDKSADRKSVDRNSADRKTRHNPSYSSLSKAFSNLHGKSKSSIQASHIHATPANFRSRSFLQSGIFSGDGGLIALFRPDYTQKKLDKENAKEIKEKVSAVKKRLKEEDCKDMSDDSINFALRCLNSKGSVEKAVELLIIIRQSLDGKIEPYNPEVYLRGAVNREYVTCYIDALLFAMFGRLDTYESVLSTDFPDEHRRRLAIILRVYVNMLRRGLLIQTDITEQLQQALSDCGWVDASSLEQQDVSEFFTQLATILDFPLLEFQVDLYHIGKEGDTDDHKKVQEHFLNIAVPETLSPGRTNVRLEDCLENYLYSRIDVRRAVDLSDRDSCLKPTISHDEGEPSAQSGISVQVSDLGTSVPASPIHSTPSSPRGGLDRSSSLLLRRKIFQDSGVEIKNLPPDANSADHNITARIKTDSDSGISMKDGSSPPKASKLTEVEVQMRAWQFFKLVIPWHGCPNDNATVEVHLRTKPIIGICLKRYGFKNNQPYRINTPVDIPLDIRLPHFLEDERDEVDGSQFAREYKLSLQSFVCHRGNTTSSGHYVSYIRGTSPIVDGDSRSNRKLSNANRPPGYSEERWIRCDDLAAPRIDTVDIEDSLQREMPYLLFYQIQPYDSVSPPETEPPSYNESAFQLNQSNLDINIQSSTSLNKEQGYFDRPREEMTPSIRFSGESSRPGTSRHSLNLPEDQSGFRRGSLPFTENSTASTGSIQGTSAPVTPSEENTETAGQRISRVAHKYRANKSRPTSQSGEIRIENRISATFSRLNLMKSKEQLNKPEESRESTSTIDTVMTPEPQPRNSTTTSGPSDEHREQLTEFHLHTGLGRPGGKKDKKREKSKGPSDRSETGLNRLHKGKEKSKGKSKDLPIRECHLM
ncbi:ubiquitin C-terminal hydrolase [Diplocarpon mali]|nr:ubiquitin C-terminal hydrolase [Diplocarpon mali]